LALQLIHDYTLGRVGPEELGARFATGLSTAPELEHMSHDDLSDAVTIIERVKCGVHLNDPVLNEISQVLSRRAMASPPIRWALIDTVATYAQALIWRSEGVDRREIGLRLAARFDEWAVQMPFTGVWRDLAKYEIRQELAFLEQCLLRTPESRGRFAERLIAAFPDDERLPELLVETGYLSSRRPS